MRLSIQEVQRLIRNYPLEVQEICLGVRDCVFSSQPEAWERPKMGGLAYFKEETSSPLKGMICHLMPFTDRVEIGFIFGAFMPDPENLLQGKQKAKRILTLTSYESVPWPALENLIHEAAVVDPTKFF
jgi:hypothetical protein